ncbi:response regulator [Ferrovibrio terrae]|jgi:two-component system chemotaxis response regulator CheY|uniref:response regulator n=1 Tax=Ferrovibrio terrae TaxID=2594003 RepID=UPI003138334F
MTAFKDLWVLLVEDDSYSQRLTQMMLKQFGVDRLDLAADGAAAIELFTEKRGHYDLIISDWNMPNVSGLDLLKHVRVSGTKARFLMLTSNAGKEFVLTARQHQVDAYIAKPFSAAQLHQKIATLFNIKAF